MILPTMKDVNVATVIVIKIYAAAFFTVNTLMIASMFGKLMPGPVKRSASAGALPIPKLINILTKGASVKVAK